MNNQTLTIAAHGSTIKEAYATENTDRNTRTKGFRVRELRPVGRNPNAREAQEKSCCEAQETGEEETELTFPLSAALPLRATLPLLGLIFSGEPLPGKATARNLRAHNGEPLRVRQLAPVIPEGLFVKIAEQMERFHADVRAVKLALYQTPEVRLQKSSIVLVWTFPRAYSTAWSTTACL